MFIHQLQGWPTFRYDLSALTDLLGEVRYEQGRLLGRVSDWGIESQLKIVAKAMVQEVMANSLIEGVKLPGAEVRSSVAVRLGLPDAGLTNATHHVDGVVAMMLDAGQDYDRPLTAERLFGWHAALFPTGHSGMAKIVVGAYRDHPDTDPMRVVSGRLGRTRVHFEAPSASLVSVQMAQLLDYINQPDPTEDGLLRAGIAHLWFLTIHPFDDGNGRIARALTDLLLARSDRSEQRFYSLSNAILTTRKYYYRELEAAQRGDLDITDWLAWFLTTVRTAIRTADKQLQAVFAKAKFWEQHRSTLLNKRQQQVLNKLWDGYQGKLTSFRYANLTDVSQDTATRDINDLVRKGILTKGTAGGRSTAYVLVEDRDK